MTAAEISHLRRQRAEVVQPVDREAQCLQQLFALRDHLGRAEQLACAGINLEQPTIENVGCRVGDGSHLFPRILHRGISSHQELYQNHASPRRPDRRVSTPKKGPGSVGPADPWMAASATRPTSVLEIAGPTFATQRREAWPLAGSRLRPREQPWR